MSKARKGRYGMIGIVLAAVMIAVMVLYVVVVGNREHTVGQHIAAKEITEFYYTDAASTDPPHYQRYHFYKEDHACQFYYEKREGDAWPLTEAHITSSGIVGLSDEDWREFLNCVEGGSVRKRSKSTAAGGSGPSLYLYWNGDRDRVQVFSFAGIREKEAFEALCAELVLRGGE